MSLMLKVTYSC